MPQLKAVAPAAESVMREFELRVRDEPIKCSSSTSTSSFGSTSVYCLKLLVIESEAGPMPSDTMKIRFLFPVGFPSSPQRLPGVFACARLDSWLTTMASATMVMVARMAYTLKPASRYFCHVDRSDLEVGLACPVSKASSSFASRIESRESFRASRGRSLCAIVRAGSSCTSEVWHR